MRNSLKIQQKLTGKQISPHHLSLLDDYKTHFVYRFTIMNEIWIISGVLNRNKDDSSWLRPVGINFHQENASAHKSEMQYEYFEHNPY